MSSLKKNRNFKNWQNSILLDSLNSSLKNELSSDSWIFYQTQHFKSVNHVENTVKFWSLNRSFNLYIKIDQAIFTNMAQKILIGSKNINITQKNVISRYYKFLNWSVMSLYTLTYYGQKIHCPIIKTCMEIKFTVL